MISRCTIGHRFFYLHISIIIWQFRKGKQYKEFSKSFHRGWIQCLLIKRGTGMSNSSRAYPAAGRRELSGTLFKVVVIILLQSMSNKYKKISKAHTRHFFFLSGREDLYFREPVTVAFKPYNRTKTRLITSITPTFNNDRSHYSSAFVLPSQPMEHESTLRADHQRRVGEALLEIEEMLVPKPRSRHRYCGVCRNHYQDYMDHTTGPDHAAALAKSYYQTLNADLCRRFQEQQQACEEDKAAEITSEEAGNKAVEELTAVKTDSTRFQ